MNSHNTKENQNKTSFEEQHREKRLFEKMLESINDVVLIVDQENGIIKKINKKALKALFGYTPEALIGKTTEMLYTDTHAFEKFRLMSEPALKRSGVFETEYEMKHKDGSVFPTLNRVTRVDDENGSGAGVVCVIRDISLRKHNENRLRMKTAELNELIKEIRCLYDISKMFYNSEVSMDANLQQAAERIPDALRYPQIAAVKISLFDKIYQTKNYRQSSNCITRDIRHGRELTGKFEVCYVAPRDDTDADVFLSEEKEMISELADRISVYVSRQLMLTALEKNEKCFVTIFNSHPNPLAIISLEDERFMKVNERFAWWSGFTPDEIIGKTAMDLNLIVDSTDRDDVLEQLNEHNYAYMPEMCVRLKSGEIRTVMHWETMIEIDGKPSIISTLSDITELKQAEKDLAESKGRIKEQLSFQQALMGTIPIPIYYKGTDRRYLGCNPAFEEFLGLPQKGVIGKTLREIMPEANLESHEASDEALLTTESVQIYEAPMIHADGLLHDVVVHKAPFYKPDGALGGLVGVVLDITHRKKLEMQLRQVQKLEAIGTLAGGIAHDFNNILSGIIGYSELALQQKDVSAIHRSVEQVFSAGLRARDLVKQILTFARSSESEDVPLRVATIVKEVTKFLRASTPAPIEIREKIETKAMINADPTHIHQLVMNLCTNAIQALRNKGGIIEIHLTDRKIGSDEALNYPAIQAGDFVALTVSDTGHGIAPEIKEKIFDPYFTTRSKEEGTGLGLSVVKGIVSKYKGEIIVESQPGKGATFTILLPVHQYSIVQKDTVPEVELPTGREFVLVVDDEQAITQLIKQQLDNLGYMVTVRASSIEALEIFRSAPHCFDLVITDMAMPDMSGKELATRLLHIRPDVRIILTTGFSSNAIEEQARAAGIRKVVFKPFAIETFAKVVRNVLDGRD